MENDERKINILLVDDNPNNLLALETILEAPDRNLVRASSGEEALRFLLGEDAAVILLDVNMPGIGGLETAALVRERERTRDVPIIFLTAYGDLGDSHISRGYSLGAVDYIVKPVDPETLKSKVAVFVELYRKTEQIKRQADLLREQNIEIENANLQRLSRLIDLGQQLAAEREPEQVLGKFCDAARAIVGARFATVGILEDDGVTPRHFFTSGVDHASAIQAGVPQACLRFLKQRFKGNRSLRLTRSNGAGIFPEQTPTESFVGAPILRQEQVCGWLYLADKTGAPAFSEADERFIVTLTQAVVFYENARLYADLRRHAAALEEEIADRKRAEAQLRDSEERLRLASSAAGLGVFEWNVQLDRAVWENERMYEIFGHTRADGTLSKAQLVERYMHPDDDATFEQALNGGMKSGRSFHTVFRIRRKDGAMRWLELAGNFELARGEAPIRMIGILADITESKRSEEANLKRVALLADVCAALAEHEAPLQSMLQKSAEAMVRRLDAAFARIWTLNPKGSLLELQASAGMYTHLNGRHSRVPVGELKIGLIAKERQPHLTNDVCNDPRVSDPEWARENGMVAFAGYPLLVEDRVVGVMAMFARHPLTEDTVEALATVAAPIAQGIERKRAEEALRASEEQFRILADKAPVLIWACGRDKLCTFFNKPWLDFTGRAMEEELGAGWTEGVHPKDYDRCLEVYVTSFEARDPFEMEYRLRRHDGEYRWILDHGVPRFSPGGDFLGYIGSCIDITERKRAEAEREQLAREQVARAAAEAANRSKDEFLAMVSHELISPLNAIFGYTRTLRSGSVDRDAVNYVTAAVERSAKAQLQIIEDLLDSARIITGKLRIEPGPVDLVPALEAALDTVRSAAEAKGVTLVADFGPLPEQVLGDSTRLQQVVWNLLTNAVKFTPEGGRVGLRMEGAADNVHITVSDTGNGIEPEFMPFVFDRFRQAAPSVARRYGGLGLGLSLVKHLVELHGGTITAESEGAGKGSTFTVTLPRRHLEFMPPPPAVTPSEVRTEGAITIDRGLSLEGVSVLVVDDQEEARELLTQALGEYGARVTAMSSGAEALAFLSNPPGGERPDAIILDIAMPDEDGYTVLKKVRALEAVQRAAADQIPAIALTAYNRSEDRLRALQEGFQMHVAKPVEPAELAVVIDSLVRRTGKGETT